MTSPTRRLRVRDPESDPLPGDFPVGSAESRAAVRAKLEGRVGGPERLEIVHHVPRPHRDPRRPHASPWLETSDAPLMRLVYRPTIPTTL